VYKRQTLLTSVVADNLTKTKHDSRRTVIGQGIGNIVVGLFGGIPGAGATMGTVTNIKAGAKTKLSGIMKGVFLLLIIVSVTEYVQYIPMAVLAGLLITIGVGIIDYKGIKMLLKVPKQDAAVWAIVLLVTLFDNLLDAVAVGFVLSAILFIGRMSKFMAISQKANAFSDMDEALIPKKLSEKVHIQNVEGPLFFGFSDRFRNHCEQIKGVSMVILNMKQVPFFDQSGLITLEAVIEDWKSENREVYISGANYYGLESMEKVKIIPNLINEDNCYDTIQKCLNSIENTEEERKNERERLEKNYDFSYN